MKINLVLDEQDSQDLVRALETAINQERFLAEKTPRVAEHAMVRARKYEELLRLVRESAVSVETIRRESECRIEDRTIEDPATS